MPERNNEKHVGFTSCPECYHGPAYINLETDNSSKNTDKLDDSFYEELFTLANKNASVSPRNEVECSDGTISYFERDSLQVINYEEEGKRYASMVNNKRTGETEVFRRGAMNHGEFRGKMRDMKSDLETLSERLPSYD